MLTERRTSLFCLRSPRGQTNQFFNISLASEWIYLQASNKSDKKQCQPHLSPGMENGQEDIVRPSASASRYPFCWRRRTGTIWSAFTGVYVRIYYKCTSVTTSSDANPTLILSNNPTRPKRVPAQDQRLNVHNKSGRLIATENFLHRKMQ